MRSRYVHRCGSIGFSLLPLDLLLTFPQTTYQTLEFDHTFTTLVILRYAQLHEITPDFIPNILAVKTRFHRSWDRGMYTDVVQSASLSFHLIFCLPFLKQYISHSNLAIHSWFWCKSDRVKSLMISSIPFSLLKHIFIGNEIEVCAPMWFNRLLSPSTWSSAYFSSNNISVI